MLNLFETFLQPRLPEIHAEAAKLSSDPAVPIIIERELDVELTIRGSEHFFEHETLENFEGLPEEVIDFTIKVNTIGIKCIGDVDGRGSLSNPRHKEINVRLIPLARYFHRESLKCHK